MVSDKANRDDKEYKTMQILHTVSIRSAISLGGHAPVSPVTSMRKAATIEQRTRQIPRSQTSATPSLRITRATTNGHRRHLCSHSEIRAHRAVVDPSPPQRCESGSKHGERSSIPSTESRWEFKVKMAGQLSQTKWQTPSQGQSNRCRSAGRNNVGLIN